jgi:hypothetical protein
MAGWKSFFLLAGALVFDEKMPRKPSSKPFETPNRTFCKMHCFGDRFVGKRGLLAHRQATVSAEVPQRPSSKPQTVFAFRFFRDQFVGKEVGLRAHKQAINILIEEFGQ